MGFYLNKISIPGFGNCYSYSFIMPATTNSSQYAYVTLSTNDEYSKGALVLGKSLREVKVSADVDLVVMVSPQVSSEARNDLQQVFDHLVDVNVYDSKDAAHLAMLKRPELGVTFTKIHCWKLTQYQKCVFMDADTMAIQNIDDLFLREELSAVPDAGWPDIFNTGVFVYKPSAETYDGLVKLAEEEGSFDGGDQGLINSYFSKWSQDDIKKHLPFLYNLQATPSYTYSPAFERFGKDAKVIHFIGANKPWGNFEPQSFGNCSAFLAKWNQIHSTKSIPAKSLLMLGEGASKVNFSDGEQDYENKCRSYDEIQAKISAKLSVK